MEQNNISYKFFLKFWDVLYKFVVFGLPLNMFVVVEYDGN